MKCCIRCIGQRVCNAVVWIAELAHVEKSWKLVYFILVAQLKIFS